MGAKVLKKQMVKEENLDNFFVKNNKGDSVKVLGKKICKTEGLKVHQTRSKKACLKSPKKKSTRYE